MGGSIFYRIGPHNRPMEYKYEHKLQPWPTIPKFMECPKEDPKLHTKTIASWEKKFVAYQTLSEECKRVLPFKYFCETQYRGNPRGFQRIPYHNFYLRKSVGGITLPYFDGTSKCTVCSWIQNLDTYFQLNPMEEKDSIKL